MVWHKMLCTLATQLDEMQQQLVSHRVGGAGDSLGEQTNSFLNCGLAAAVADDGHEDDGILNRCQALADHHS